MSRLQLTLVLLRGFYCFAKMIVNGCKSDLLPALLRVAKFVTKLEAICVEGAMLIGQKNIFIGHSALILTILIGHFRSVTCW
jgi:hypothetical protein